MMILLTAEEADQVRGYSDPEHMHELMPIPLVDGTFVLSLEVLSDPYHGQKQAFLASKPKIPDPAREDYLWYSALVSAPGAPA
jgi:hypothetical protein